MKNLIKFIAIISLCFSSYAFAGSYTIINNGKFDIQVADDYTNKYTHVTPNGGTGTLGGVSANDQLDICWARYVTGEWDCISVSATYCYATKDNGQITISGDTEGQLPTVTGDCTSQMPAKKPKQ